ncbi:hypothetical protein GCM10009557_25360 [Virgisporangium ochraceum]
MSTLDYGAAAVTVLMSLLNLPFAFGGRVVGWLVTLLGVVGLVAAVALLRRVSGAPSAVTAVGVVNGSGAVLALAWDRDGAVVGIVVSALVTVLGLACLRTPA